MSASAQSAPRSYHLAPGPNSIADPLSTNLEDLIKGQFATLEVKFADTVRAVLTNEHKAKDDHLIAQLRIALGEDLSKMSQALHVELDSMIKREIKKMQATLLDSIKPMDCGAYEKMAEQSDKTADTLRSLRQEVDAEKSASIRLTSLVEESQRAQRHLTARLEVLEEAQRTRQQSEAAEGTQRATRGGNQSNYSVSTEMASPSVRSAQRTDSQDHHRQNEETGSQRLRNDGHEPGELRRSRSNVFPQEQGAFRLSIPGLRAPPNAPRPSGLRMPRLPPFLQRLSNDSTSSARRWSSNHGNMPARSRNHLVSVNQPLDDAAGGSRAKRLRRNEGVMSGCDSCNDDGGFEPDEEVEGGDIERMASRWRWDY